jgi:hypothetical protein
MVSAELAQSTSPLTKLGKPIRVLFSLLPYLAALALIAYGMSYLLRSESGQTGDNFNPSLGPGSANSHSDQACAH